MTQEEQHNDAPNVEKLLIAAYDHIKKQDLDAAVTSIEKALSIDFDNDEVISALKFVNFWKDRQETVESITNEFEKGEYLLNQWTVFENFYKRQKGISERCIQVFRQLIFGEALLYYLRSNDELNGKDVELLLRIGRCYKGKGDYENALKYLEKANTEKRDDPEILAQLADCYALTNDDYTAKVFFREAFFHGPGIITLESLESEMMKRLIAKVREQGYRSPLLEEWLPVYGVIYGVLNVKRELRSIEYGKLRQSIFAIERELHESGNEGTIQVPRLINRYFWLIDHYVNAGEDRVKIDEILMKIKDLDDEIYEQYTN